MPDTKISDLPRATYLDDDSLLVAEQLDEAVAVDGALFKSFAQEATKGFAESASADAATAVGAKTAAQSALAGVQSALNNLPAGDTLIINDLTTGGTSAALSAEMGRVLAQRPNPNLLHNWYFANPVNQRGKTSYSGNVYTIDRWNICHSTASVELVGGGVRLVDSITGYLAWRQKVENYAEFAGKQVTLSVFVADIEAEYRVYIEPTDVSDDRIILRFSEPGLHSITATLPETLTRLYVTFSPRAANAPVTFKAVKLELGDMQTLAHQDSSGNWVLNEIPDYGEELAKCQRYQVEFVPSDSTSAVSLGTVMASSQTRSDGTIPLPTTLRTKPAVTYFGDFVLSPTGRTSDGIAVTSMEINARDAAGCCGITVRTDGSLEIGRAYSLLSLATTLPRSLLLDANL